MQTLIAPSLSLGPVTGPSLSPLIAVGEDASAALAFADLVVKVPTQTSEDSQGIVEPMIEAVLPQAFWTGIAAKEPSGPGEGIADIPDVAVRHGPILPQAGREAPILAPSPSDPVGQAIRLDEFVTPTAGAAGLPLMSEKAAFGGLTGPAAGGAGMRGAAPSPVLPADLSADPVGHGLPPPQPGLPVSDPPGIAVFLQDSDLSRPAGLSMTPVDMAAPSVQVKTGPGIERLTEAAPSAVFGKATLLSPELPQKLAESPAPPLAQDNAPRATGLPAPVPQLPPDTRMPDGRIARQVPLGTDAEPVRVPVPASVATAAEPADQVPAPAVLDAEAMPLRAAVNGVWLWQGRFIAEGLAQAATAPKQLEQTALSAVLPTSLPAISEGEIPDIAFLSDKPDLYAAPAATEWLAVTLPDPLTTVSLADPLTVEVGLSFATPSGIPSGGGGVQPSIHQTAMPQLAGQIVETLVRQTEGTTEIALSPAELGRVQVSLQTDTQNPDRVSVMLAFERPETMDLFRRHVDQLADALRAAGYSGVDIGFGQQGAGQGNSAPPPPQGEWRGDGLPQPELQEDAARPLRLAATTSLDLRL